MHVFKTEFFLFMTPIFVMFPFLILYRFQGRKNFLSFDLVQFVYNFVFVPLSFVWLKTVLYTLLVANEAYVFSPKQLFFADTGFSLIMLYVYAFFTMHFLTKTFKLKNTEPLYDLFTHSEYIHLWLSHIVMFAGTMLIITILALVNLLFPLEIVFSFLVFALTLSMSLILGSAVYFVILVSTVQQKKRLTLTRLMKLVIGFCFSFHLIGYLLFDPGFDSRFILFWSGLMFFAGAFSVTILDYRSEKTRKLLRQILARMKHQGWGENIQLFTEK